jgi:hypothetical protein
LLPCAAFSTVALAELDDQETPVPG